MSSLAWPCLALPGLAWPCLALLGLAWLCLALPGLAWPCLALPDLALHCFCLVLEMRSVLETLSHFARSQAMVFAKGLIA